MSEERKYLKLGVDVHKRGIEFFEELIKPVFPHAFTTIVKDPETSEGIILHVDGAGSKPIVAYIYYKETDRPQWFRGLAQDVIAMNIDDIITVGAKPIAFADYIAVNAFRLPRLKVLNEISLGFKESLNLIINVTSSLKNRIRITFAGGETADLPDQVRTLDLVGIILARLPLSQAISGDNISEGDVIIGLRSGGRAIYEAKENSGIMCNGITLARHVLLSKEYELKYPEICDPISKERYYGRYKIDDYLDELNMTVGEALLSPTRIYTPIIAEILERYPKSIKGMVHNTGGGLTKILRIGSGLRFIKDNLPFPDPIFCLIQNEGKVNWEEMYEVFNMGIGFEIITNRDFVDDIISICEKYRVEAYVIGKVERGVPGINEVIIKSTNGTFIYQKQIE